MNSSRHGRGHGDGCCPQRICENLLISMRETNGPSVARGGRPGAVSAGCGAGGGAICPLPSNLRSGDQTSKR
jgi:hypothetical protein